MSDAFKGHFHEHKREETMSSVMEYIEKLSNYWYLLLMVKGLLYDFFMFSYCMTVISWGLFCLIQDY